MIRPREKALIVASLTILFFFSYGHVFDTINRVGSYVELIARHRYLVPAWAVIYCATLIWAIKLRNPSKTTYLLNLISIVLMASVSTQLLFLVLKTQFVRNVSSEEIPAISSTFPTSAGRNVYYILLDAYGRQDLLMEDYGVDNSAFISELKNMGFYIPNCAQSNYDQTTASMSSSLNMQYLDALGVAYGESGAAYKALIVNNEVRNQFEKLGYSTVTFKSLYPWLDITDSTYYYDYFANESGVGDLASLNFQYIFLRTTILRPLLQWLEVTPDIKLSPFLGLWVPVNNTLESREYKQYQQNTFALDTLETLPNLPDNKLVYAHLYITHQPFVFYPDGRFHPFLLQTENAYRDQVVFANKRILEVLKLILSSTEADPIIVLQSDHSYSEGEKRLQILNAYYFPEGGDKNLYDMVTPVNTFRILFNTYYGGNYELLPDISWAVDEHEALYKAPVNCMNDVKP